GDEGAGDAAFGQFRHREVDDLQAADLTPAGIDDPVGVDLKGLVRHLQGTVLPQHGEALGGDEGTVGSAAEVTRPRVPNAFGSLDGEVPRPLQGEIEGAARLPEGALGDVV